MKNWQYDTETAVSEVSTGRWSTRISSAWNIGTTPNGGYVAASGLRAMGRQVDQPDPVSVTTYYLRPGLGDQPGDVSLEIIRAGRRTSSATASLHQQGKERLRMVAAFADLEAPGDGEPTPPALSIPMIDLPPPDACRSRTTVEQGVDVAITSRLDVRLAPAPNGGAIDERAEVAGWVRFADNRPPDAEALVLFADAFPPSVFAVFGSVGWVPTLELTVHVRRRPVAGWIAARFRTRDLANGLFVEDGELWDESGNLVAQSRQLAMLLRK
ncbi:MAG: thioesterase family protein [Aquisalimonadaceae bacterium]